MDRLKLFPQQLGNFDNDECCALTVCDLLGNILNTPFYHGFTYAATQFLEGVTPNTGGTDPWTALQSAIAYGCLPTSMASDVASVASELYEANWANWSPAEKKAALGFQGIAPKDVGVDYDGMITWMQKTGEGVMVPLSFFSSFLNAPGGVLPPPSGTTSPHCVAVYLVNGEPVMKPLLGPDWGNGGYGNFTRELFDTIVKNVFAIDPYGSHLIAILTIAASKRPYLYEYLSSIITNQAFQGEIMQTENGQKLYDTAASFLDKQVAPMNAADKYGVLACAVTVNLLAEKAWGAQIGGGYSTAAMWEFLKDQTKFQAVAISSTLPGDLVISPTGSATNARLKNGHVGVIAKYGILSNNSETGTLTEAFDLVSWQAYFTTYGGLPTLCYRPL